MDTSAICGITGAGLLAVILGLPITSHGLNAMSDRSEAPATQPHHGWDAVTIAGSSGEIQRTASGERADKGSPSGAQPSCDGFTAMAGNQNVPQCIRPGSGESFQDCPDCPEMVAVPAGSYMMGSPENEEGRYANEGPLHKVTIAKPFAVGKFAITVEDYLACVNAGACKPPEWIEWGGAYNISSGADPLYKRLGEALIGNRYPIIGVSWDDAKSYVNWLSNKTEKDYRLLSEAEFEYAARAGTATPFWWGLSISTSQANYNGTYTYAGSEKSEYRAKPVPVDSFQPNPWGLYQVHGNVWTWIEDCWVDNYDDAPADGSARQTKDCTAHDMRGGSWDNVPNAVRAAIRSHFGEKSSHVGFRVARSF